MTVKKPNMNSESEKELARVDEQFETFSNQVEEMTLDRMNAAPKQDLEPQTKISQQDLAKSNDLYLKPHRIVSSQDKFNEKFRKDYNFDKEYVQFTAENKEIIGETIDIWTRPYGGMPAEWWKVPVNKPVWGPRYLAEQIKRCYYHRLIMQPNQPTESNGLGQFYGSMAADTTIQRLDALPVSTRRSVFMGSTSFK
jgi:hypothetical protein